MRLLISTLLSLLSFSLFAQVTGVVTDQQGQPLPGASVAAYNQANELLDGTTTGTQGGFSLDLKAGTYNLEISFIAFNTDKRQIEVGGQALNLGEIKLSEASTSLEEVTVEGEAKMMEFRQDKRVFNVSQDLTSAGSNASDLLNNIPSVAVDIEGNISLRGSGNVRILVNGKPSGLIGSDPAKALRQLQASMIERVEVITNPSARYDAEGEAGIINIVLKKNTQAGLNGTFEVNTGIPHNHGASAGVNYRTGKVNLFMNGSVNYRKAPGGGFSEQEFFFEDTTYSFYRDRDQLRGGLNAALRLGADYNITPNQTITGTFLYRPGLDNNATKITYRDYDAKGDLKRIQVREDDEMEDEMLLEGDLHWEKQFEEKDHKWTADFQFQDDNDLETSDIEQSTVGEDDVLRQKVSNQEDEQSIMFQTDYVRPFTEVKSFELGSRVTLRDIINDYSLREQNSSGSYEIQPQFTNDFRYIENVYAAYGIYNDAWGEKITYQGGLRLEYTDLTTELLSENDPNRRTYLNLFPSAFFTYDINTLSDIQLSYSRRISRPHFRSLLPFFSFSDNRNFYSGNPDLNPEFTDSYEAGYIRYWENASLYSGVYYRHRTGVVERISTVDSTGFTTIFPVNLAVQDAYGFEFNYQHDLFKWWDANANVNIYYAVTSGEFEGVDYGAEAFTSTGRLMNRFKFWDSDLQLSFNYRAPRNTAQGRTLGIYTMDLGWSKDFWNDDATVTLSLRDVFNGRRRRSYTSGPNFDSYSEFQWRQRQFTVSFTYRLNQQKQRGRRGGGDGGGMGDGGDF